MSDLKHKDDFFVDENCGYMDHNIDGELRLGARYSTFVELQKAVDVYCKKNNVRFFRSDSRKLKSAPNRINPQIIEKTPDYLVYYSLTYTCVFGGKSFKCRNKPENNNSFQEGCKFIIRIGLTKNCQMLQVIKMSDPKMHNHELSESVLADMPKVRSSFTSTSSVTKGVKLRYNRDEILNTSKKIQEASLGCKTKSRVNKGQLLHEHNLVTMLSKCRETGLFCDTAIVARDGMLFAHSAVLALNCPMLYSMINQQPFYKPKSNMIDLAKYTSVIINDLLDFFYFGKISMKNWPEVQELAEALGMAFKVVDDDDDESTMDFGEDDDIEADIEEANSASFDVNSVGDSVSPIKMEEINKVKDDTTKYSLEIQSNKKFIKGDSVIKSNESGNKRVHEESKVLSETTQVNKNLKVDHLKLRESKNLQQSIKMKLKKNLICVRCKKSFFSRYDCLKHRKFLCKFYRQKMRNVFN